MHMYELQLNYYIKMSNPSELRSLFKEKDDAKFTSLTMYATGVVIPL